jgi:hypothetical protein
MSNECRGCKQTVRTEERLKCVDCQGVYHFQCLSLTAENYKKLGRDLKAIWRCPVCKNSGTRKGDNSNKPVGQCTETNESGKIVADTKDEQPMIAGAGDKVNEVLVNEIIRRMRTVIAEENETLKKEVRNSIDDLRDSIEFMQEERDKLEGRVRMLEEGMKRNSVYEEQVDTLKRKLQECERQNNIMRQEALSKNIEIYGVPSRSDMDVYSQLKEAGKKFSITIQDEDMEYVRRLPPKESGTSSIILTLQSQRKKEEIIKAARSQKAVSRQTGIYFNDHLTLENKIIYKNARTAAKRNNFRFVWVKYGRIYVRERERSNVILIRNQRDREEKIGKLTGNPEPQLHIEEDSVTTQENIQSPKSPH